MDFLLQPLFFVLQGRETVVKSGRSLRMIISCAAVPACGAGIHLIDLLPVFCLD